MNDRLKQFLDDAFKPYGTFPARRDVEQELLANLTEKYNDLIASGKTQAEAYSLTTESLGDVSEIMEHVGHDTESANEDEKDFAENDSRFRATSIMNADLADAKLSGANFSMSAIMGTNFEKSDLREAKFKAAALKGASFIGADLTGANFDSSDVQAVNFDDANLTDAKLNRCGLKGASFKNATLNNTEFKGADVSGISFDGQILRGTIFDSSSLKQTTFKNATMENVSFHHCNVKKVVFDGATMDKVTYALLKGMKANLDNVTIS